MSRASHAPSLRLTIPILFHKSAFPAIAATLLIAGAAHAQATYSAVDLGSGTTGTAINDKGAVVGSVNANGNTYPFTYSNGALTSFSVPGIAGYDWAYGINDAGVIVGSGYVHANTTAEPYVGFVDTNGTFQILSNPGGTVSFTAINGAGLVTGQFALNFGNFFWDGLTYSNGTFTSIGTFSPSWVTTPLAINGSGTIVGYNSFANSNHGRYAFSWSDGTFTELTMLPGWTQASAGGINDAGTIVGFGLTGGGDENAFSDLNNVMTDLGTLPGFTDSVADGINDAGAIVGFDANTTAIGEDPSDHAFVDVGGSMFDLNTELSNSIGTYLTQAVAINDVGQIVAEGEDGDAYLLTPAATPEPSSVVYAGVGVAAGAVLMVFGRGRRRHVRT